MRVAPKSRWGRFLVNQRESKGLTQTAVFSAVRADLGWGPTSRAAYGDLERGDREPTVNEQAYFLARYGLTALPSESEDEHAPDLAVAIRALTVELAAMRREREAWQSGWIAVLRAYGEGQVPTELLDALAPQPLEDARQ